MKTLISAVLIFSTFICFAQKDSTKHPTKQDLINSAVNPFPKEEANPTEINGNLTYKYRAQVLSTNFTIPILRVNFLANDLNAVENKEANASFFNSIGAGIGYSFGRLERTQDSKGNDIKQSWTNIFGVQLGVLFAANAGTNNATTTTTSNTTSTNIFAITGALTILNFQFGVGYELGTIANGQRRGFATIAYAIPLSSLVKGGYWVTHKVLVDPGKGSDALYSQ